MSDSKAPRPMRPVLLMLTMLLCIVMGWSGMAMGCNTIQAYRSPSLQDPPLREGEDPRIHEQVVALTQAMRPVLDESRPVRLPLAIANMLLSALLVVATTRALGGRPGAWGLAVQAVLANAALAIAEFVSTASFRARSAVVFSDYFANILALDGNARLESPDQITVILRGTFVGVFAATLGTYGIALFALTRPASREYLAPGPEDESDFDHDNDDDEM
ncbi:MAG: hypothetical protein U0165_16125 [Polyangiaceae bacterium]